MLRRRPGGLQKSNEPVEGYDFYASNNRDLFEYSLDSDKKSPEVHDGHLNTKNKTKYTDKTQHDIKLVQEKIKISTGKAIDKKMNSNKLTVHEKSDNRDEITDSHVPADIMSHIDKSMSLNKPTKTENYNDLVDNNLNQSGDSNFFIKEQNARRCADRPVISDAVETSINTICDNALDDLLKDFSDCVIKGNDPNIELPDIPIESVLLNSNSDEKNCKETETTKKEISPDNVLLSNFPIKEKIPQSSDEQYRNTGNDDIVDEVYYESSPSIAPSTDEASTGAIGNDMLQPPEYQTNEFYDVYQNTERIHNEDITHGKFQCEYKNWQNPPQSLNDDKIYQEQYNPECFYYRLNENCQLLERYGSGEISEMTPSLINVYEPSESSFQMIEGLWESRFNPCGSQLINEFPPDQGIRIEPVTDYWYHSANNQETRTALPPTNYNTCFDQRDLRIEQWIDKDYRKLEDKNVVDCEYYDPNYPHDSRNLNFGPYAPSLNISEVSEANSSSNNTFIDSNRKNFNTPTEYPNSEISRNNFYNPKDAFSNSTLDAATLEKNLSDVVGFEVNLKNSPSHTDMQTKRLFNDDRLSSHSSQVTEPKCENSVKDIDTNIEQSLKIWLKEFNIWAENYKRWWENQVSPCEASPYKTINTQNSIKNNFTDLATHSINFDGCISVLNDSLVLPSFNSNREHLDMNQLTSHDQSFDSQFQTINDFNKDQNEELRKAVNETVRDISDRLVYPLFHSIRCRAKFSLGCQSLIVSSPFKRPLGHYYAVKIIHVIPIDRIFSYLHTLPEFQAEFKLENSKILQNLPNFDEKNNLAQSIHDFHAFIGEKVLPAVNQSITFPIWTLFFEIIQFVKSQEVHKLKPEGSQAPSFLRNEFYRCLSKVFLSLKIPGSSSPSYNSETEKIESMISPHSLSQSSWPSAQLTDPYTEITEESILSLFQKSNQWEFSLIWSICFPKLMKHTLDEYLKTLPHHLPITSLIHFRLQRPIPLISDIKYEDNKISSSLNDFIILWKDHIGMILALAENSKNVPDPYDSLLSIDQLLLLVGDILLYCSRLLNCDKFLLICSQMCHIVANKTLQSLQCVFSSAIDDANSLSCILHLIGVDPCMYTFDSSSHDSDFFSQSTLSLKLLSSLPIDVLLLTELYYLFCTSIFQHQNISNQNSCNIKSETFIQYIRYVISLRLIDCGLYRKAFSYLEQVGRVILTDLKGYTRKFIFYVQSNSLHLFFMLNPDYTKPSSRCSVPIWITNLRSFCDMSSLVGSATKTKKVDNHHREEASGNGNIDFPNHNPSFTFNNLHATSQQNPHNGPFTEVSDNSFYNSSFTRDTTINPHHTNKIKLSPIFGTEQESCSASVTPMDPQSNQFVENAKNNFFFYPPTDRTGVPIIPGIASQSRTCDNHPTSIDNNCWRTVGTTFHEKDINFSTNVTGVENSSMSSAESGHQEIGEKNTKNVEQIHMEAAQVNASSVTSDPRLRANYSSNKNNGKGIINSMFGAFRSLKLPFNRKSRGFDIMSDPLEPNFNDTLHPVTFVENYGAPPSILSDSPNASVENFSSNNISIDQSENASNGSLTNGNTRFSVKSRKRYVTPSY